MAEYRTKSGKVLTDADIEAMADDCETNPEVRAAVQRGVEWLFAEGLVEIDGDDIVMTQKGWERARER